MSALFAGACAQRTALSQPIGESFVSGAAEPSPSHDADAAAPEPGDPERYVTGQSAGPCGMDQLPVISFASTSTETDEVQARELKELAGCLTSPPFDTASVILVGYTDIVGTVPANLELGLQRARSVMHQLTQLGVAPSRIVVASAGELQRPSARWGFRAHRVEVHLARGGPPRANEEPISRGIDAEGLIPRPRAQPTSTAAAKPAPTPPPARPATPPRNTPPATPPARGR